MRFAGKVALITGGGSGIGQGIAHRLAEEGADIAVVDIEEAQARETVHRIQRLGRRALALAADVSVNRDVERILRQTLEAMAGLDVLVNNAGTVTARGTVLELAEEDWDRVMAVNVKSYFLCSQAAARYWVASRRPGAIINISSLAAERCGPSAMHYAVSKAAVKMLTQASARQLGQYGIRVNAIGPGWIRTGLTRRLFEDDAWVHRTTTSTPLGRLGEPADVASVAAFLASEDAAYMTGASLYVDGGRMWVSGE